MYIPVGKWALSQLIWEIGRRKKKQKTVWNKDSKNVVKYESESYEKNSILADYNIC